MYKDSKTEHLDIEAIKKHIFDITGEDISELLQMANRDDVLEEAHWALHMVIIYANENGN